MMDFLHLVASPPENSLLYEGNYDPILVFLSIAVATFASYAALLVSQHVSSSTTARGRRGWLAAGGLCLGIGIWAMHFVGMLAFKLSCSSGYNITLTLLSALPGILASTLALAIISRRENSPRQIATGGLLIGAGIGAMHYAGMAAMRLEGLIRYDIKLFLLSVVVAVALAIFALWVKFRLQSWPLRWRGWAPVCSALVMGMAVSGMHYTAMAAAYFIRDGDTTIVDSRIGSSFLAAIILAATGVITVVTIVAKHLTTSTSHAAHEQPYKVVALLIVAWGGVAWLSADNYYNHLASDLYQQELKLATQQAQNLANNIEESLQVLKGIPLVLSRDAEILRMARRFGANATPSPLEYTERKQRWSEDKALGKLNKSLTVAAPNLRADAIWIINAAGDCIAASTADKPESFVGTNYAFRDYFRQAQAGQAGKQYALGKTSKAPGLYYSYPIIDAGHFLGAVVVKRNISSLAYWTSQADAFISDSNGVIVMAADKSLRFRILPGASVTKLSVEQTGRFYRRSAFDPLEITPWENGQFPAAVRIDGSDLPIVLASATFPENPIVIHVSRSLEELVRLGREKYWLFILLATAGGTLITAASAVVIHLRASRKAEADLRIAATAFEAQEGMVITDPDNVILRVNRAFSEMTGYTPEEAVGQKMSLLQSGRHNPAFYNDMWECIQRDGFWQGEIWDRRKTGEISPKWLTITAVRGKDGTITHYVGTHTDITHRKAAEDEIRHLAFYDQLTSLPNRRLLLDRLHLAVTTSARSSRYGALLFIDLDNFKTLNDTLGHEKGDLLLQQVAQRLTDCVRAGDTVARLGGDEFVIMLENLSEHADEAANQTEAIGEKILAALNQPYQLAQHKHCSTPSIGITLFGNQQESQEELLKRADLAMYQAKASGRNTLRFFDPEMQAVVKARATLEADLHEAILSGQFVLYYQVQVDGEGRPTGAEALVRWQHPQRALVSPAEFIPVAEETGMIQPLGHWVLETACAQLVSWAQASRTAHFTLAVNVSACQFRHPDFVEQVLVVLDQSHANPQKLKLELTESILVHDVEGVIAKMTLLKARGVGFSLDDFGTGYSSLSYLKRLPLDQLKIDQSFVRNILTDANDAAIARTIISLTESLGLAVIAEGVESAAQRDFLADNGCRSYQGYFFGRPLPIAEFELALAP